MKNCNSPSYYFYPLCLVCGSVQYAIWWFLKQMLNQSYIILIRHFFLLSIFSSYAIPAPFNCAASAATQPLLPSATAPRRRAAELPRLPPIYKKKSWRIIDLVARKIDMQWSQNLCLLSNYLSLIMDSNLFWRCIPIFIQTKRRYRLFICSRDMYFLVTPIHKKKVDA